MRIAICDDDKSDRDALSACIEKCGIDSKAELFSCSEDFFAAARETPTFDIVFLDIYLSEGNKDETGIDIAKKLRRCSPKTDIVFTTTSREFAVDAFEVKALHYLVKPVNAQQVSDAFSRLSEKQSTVRRSLSVKIGRNIYAVYLDDIIYLESVAHNTLIHKRDGSNLSVYAPISSFIDKIRGQFLLVQRGLCVNMDYIQTMHTDSCILRSGQTVLLSRNSRAQIRSEYDDYVFSRLKDGKS